jgi:hypothetical protein
VRLIARHRVQVDDVFACCDPQLAQRPPEL